MEKELINKLLGISLKIFECYKSLKHIELVEGKNSINYINNINLLRALFKEEKSIYDEITDRELIQRLLLCLSEKDKINNVIEDLNILIDNDTNMIKRRIIIHLLDKKQKMDKSTLIKMAKEVDAELKELKVSFKNSYYGLINLLNLSEETKIDFIKGILLIINNDNELDKETFINLLYNSSFLFPFCEKYLLNNGFIIEEDLFFSKNIVADINKMSHEEVLNTNKLYGLEIIKHFKDKIVNDYIKVIIRTALLFCSDDEIKEIDTNKNIHDIIELNKQDKCFVKTIRIGCGYIGK